MYFFFLHNILNEINVYLEIVNDASISKSRRPCNVKETITIATYNKIHV